MGPSWDALGRSWGRLGGLLGPSWGLLGPSWGHLEASKAHRKQKRREGTHHRFSLVFDGFWRLGEVLRGLREHLEPSCGPLEASWRHDGGHLERSCAILRHLGGHLGASEALLEPSWAILDALTPRGPPRPGPGEGVGGGVNPSPEQGKEEVLAERRQSSLNHLHPEGWWDLDGPGRPKRPPRRSKKPPRGPKTHPRCAQDASKRPPRGLQGTPKTLKTVPRHPRCPPP